MIDHQTHLPIKVRYLCPTNTKGSRVKMISLVTGDSVVIPFNHHHNVDNRIAQDWLESKGLNCIGLIQDHIHHETILLLDWNQENIDLLKSIKLWS